MVVGRLQSSRCMADYDVLLAAGWAVGEAAVGVGGRVRGDLGVTGERLIRPDHAEDSVGSHAQANAGFPRCLFKNRDSNFPCSGSSPSPALTEVTGDGQQHRGQPGGADRDPDRGERCRVDDPHRPLRGGMT